MAISVKVSWITTQTLGLTHLPYGPTRTPTKFSVARISPEGPRKTLPSKSFGVQIFEAAVWPTMSVVSDLRREGIGKREPGKGGEGGGTHNDGM